MTQPSTAPSDRTGFVQAIGRLDGIALVAGSMIGAGIFITPADMMRQVHAPSLFLLAWMSVVFPRVYLGYAGRMWSLLQEVLTRPHG